MRLNSIVGLEGEEFTGIRVDAAEKKIKPVDITESELLLEQLLRTRGYR